MKDESADMSAYITDLTRRNWAKGFINGTVTFALYILNDEALSSEERREEVMIYLTRQSFRYDKVMGLGRQQ